jgi:hypothetical protein
MQKPLARLIVGWLMMLGGGCLMLESGLVDLRTANRTVQALLALSGFALAVTGVILRRAATRRPQS